MNQALRAVAVMAIGLWAGACAIIDESIDIKPQLPAQAEAIAPDSAGITVAVKAADVRTQHRDRVATKKNGYGIEMAKITSTKDVPELVRSSVEADLKAHGYTIGEGGLVATVELTNFYSDFKPAFLVPVADSASEVSFNVKLTIAGNLVYSNYYSGLGSRQDVLIMTPGASRSSLEHALTDAVSKVDKDQALFAAMSSRGALASASPPVSAPTARATSAPAMASSLPTTQSSSQMAASAGTWVDGPSPGLWDCKGGRTAATAHYSLAISVAADKTMRILSYNSAEAVIISTSPLKFTAMNPRGDRLTTFVWNPDNSMSISGPNYDNPSRDFHDVGFCVKAGSV